MLWKEGVGLYGVICQSAVCSRLGSVLFQTKTRTQRRRVSTWISAWGVSFDISSHQPFSASGLLAPRECCYFSKGITFCLLLGRMCSVGLRLAVEEMK